MRKNIHTVYNKENKTWENKVEKSSFPISVHRKKEDAQSNGRQFATFAQVEHFIHDRLGKISERNTYHKDPFPPKG